MRRLSPALIEEIQARRTVKDNDVARVRACLAAAPLLAPADVDALFAITAACPVQTPAWSALLVELTCDYVLRQLEPHGYVTADNAVWLMRRIAHQGRVRRRIELELLITVLEQARWAPSALAAFALEQVKLAVLLGDGPIRAVSRSQVNTVTEEETGLLRRILMASCAGDGLPVSRAELEVLFEIDEAVGRSANHPSWSDLFVKALATALMSTSGYRVPPRAEALCRHDAAVPLHADAEALPAAACGLAQVFAGYRLQTPDQRGLVRLEHQRRQIVTGERSSEPDAYWLADRLACDGAPTPNMVALACFLRLRRPTLHHALQAQILRLSHAA